MRPGLTASRPELVIECSPGEVRAALTEGGVLVELLVVRRTDGPRYGEVHRGRVSRIEHGMNAAFVEIDSGPAGFLPLSGPARRLAEGAVVAVSIAAEAATGKGPRLAMADATKNPAGPNRETELAAVLRNYDPASLARVVADGASCSARIRAAWRALAPDAADRIESHTGDTPAFEAYGIEEQIERALAPVIELASGLRLHFGALEALAAIDVDAASFAPRQAGRATALAANLAAAGEIVRQIRLRNLAGLILVDFLRMKDSTERKRVSEAFAGLAAADPVPLHVHGFTRAGLLELTRERRRRTLADVLLEPGQPRRKSAETVAREALRRAMRAVRGPSVLVAAGDVVAWFEGEGRAELADCQAFLHTSLKLRANPDFPRDRFEIIGERP